MGQCGGCRLPPTLRDIGTGKAFAAGYAKPFDCILDPDIGVESDYADSPRLYLAHHEIVAQGRMVEEALRVVRGSEENLARYNELKGATGCNGISTPISILEDTNASTFF